MIILLLGILEITPSWSFKLCLFSNFKTKRPQDCSPNVLFYQENCSERGITQPTSWGLLQAKQGVKLRSPSSWPYYHYMILVFKIFFKYVSDNLFFISLFLKRVRILLRKVVSLLLLMKTIYFGKCWCWQK